jgi:hypothetical protein
MQNRDRADQIDSPSPRPVPDLAPDEPVAPDIVAAPRRRPHDRAIAQRLRYGLLRLPLGREGAPPRW